MRFTIITLFPELIEQALPFGVLGRAIKNGLIQVETVNPRSYATDKHRTVDDSSYGGGPGMVLKYEPLKQAIEQIKNDGCNEVLCLSPQGEVFNQQIAHSLSKKQHIILLAGRYEGIDQRLLDRHVDRELSTGDYVVSGGEMPALLVIDAVARLIPGVLGHEESASYDSHQSGLLDHPHYTRPAEVDGMKVPEVLLSGDHKKIAEWREQQAFAATLEHRPDMIEKLELTQRQRELLTNFSKNKTN